MRNVRLAALALLLVCASRAQAADRHPNEVYGPSTVARKPVPPGEQPVRGGTVVLALLSDIDSLNPYLSSSADASEVHDLIFPRLMVEEPTYPDGPPKFAAHLAESWTYGEDGRSIRFTLREATWSDGTPITADDVRFSWTAAKDPQVAWTNASIVDQITDVEVHGPREFTVRYAVKYPYQTMDMNDVQILPRHTFGKVPFEKWQGYGLWDEQARVGAGPFRFSGYVQNQEITLVRNERWWEPGRPHLDKVVFRIIPNQQQQLNTLLAGDIDFVEQVQPKDVRRVLDSGKLDLYTYQSRGFGYVGWNCARFPFDDVRVRRAMTLAIDRENIVESVWYGHAKLAAPHIISSMWMSNKKVQPLPFDPDEAERLLQEAGFKKGSDGIYAKDGKRFRFTLQTNAGNKVREEILGYVQSNLRGIGVECEIRLSDFNLMYEQFKHHQFDAYVGGWYVATKVDLKETFHSTSTEGRHNYVVYRDPRVDELIDKARVMEDIEAQRPLWDEVQVILDRDQPYTMLYEPRGLVAASKRLRNVEVNALRALVNLGEWWIAAAK